VVIYYQDWLISLSYPLTIHRAKELDLSEAGTYALPFTAGFPSLRSIILLADFLRAFCMLGFKLK
jgi:hypothetical protein